MSWQPADLPPIPRRTALRKYDHQHQEPYDPPRVTDDDQCPHQAPVVYAPNGVPEPPLCQLRKHTVKIACEASGTTDGIRWHVQWWPADWMDRPDDPAS